MLVIATPDTLDVRRMIEIARTVNPRIETVVRTHSEEEAVLLEKENAGKVFLGEHELARDDRHVLDRSRRSPTASLAPPTPAYAPVEMRDESGQPNQSALGILVDTVSLTARFPTVDESR